jgi:uncharacterized repeat protein (TIGR04052 family)
MTFRDSALCAVAALCAACASEPVTIHFAGKVGADPFSCTSTYPGLGATGTTWSPQDFRFYVSGVSVIDSKGVSVPLTLKQDGVWQTGDVALLDFENATGGCENGTPETNDAVIGTIPAGHTITGLQFDLGVSAGSDHLDVSTAQSPLNVSGLYWSWMAGYIFLKIDGITTMQPQGYSFHLGSTSCSGNGASSTCANANRPHVVLQNFDPAHNTVVADLAKLFQGADLDTEQVPPGCLSEPNNCDCVPFFGNLGLPLQTLDADCLPYSTGSQVFFRVE